MIGRDLSPFFMTRGGKNRSSEEEPTVQAAKAESNLSQNAAKPKTVRGEGGNTENLKLSYERKKGRTSWKQKGNKVSMRIPGAPKKEKDKASSSRKESTLCLRLLIEKL